jgi:hypothetical protein
MDLFPYPDARRFLSVQIHDTEQSQPGGWGGGADGSDLLGMVLRMGLHLLAAAKDRSPVLRRTVFGHG